MTKSRQRGENEITEAARREAARTGKNIRDILRAMLRKAKSEKSTEKAMKILQAQKFLRERNRRKRRGRS